MAGDRRVDGPCLGLYIPGLPSEGAAMNTRRMTRLQRYWALVALAACVGGGCVWPAEDRGKLDLGVEPSVATLARSAAYRDSIGALAYYEGLTPMRVRGYGLVVGLGRNGSRGCPRHVHDRLVRSLYKQQRLASPVVGESGVTPERLIDDVDTAVVVVHGEIPPAATRGGTFDVAVTAVPGTQTKSLRGGRLLGTELQVYRAVSTTTSITGRVLAHASGPVFINPFSQGESATRSNPLEGVVVGGGLTAVDRRVRLVLRQASYQRARQIQDRINGHFPGPRMVADAVSPSFVRLRIPEEYRDDTAHFLSLVRALYLTRDPRFQAARALQLAEEIQHGTAPHALIALGLEGLGRAALPVLDDLYAHPRETVSFHGAAAGLRLGDHVAGDAMILHAEDATGNYRPPAIRALGRAEGMAATAMALRRLLDDEDPRIRIAAYEALLERKDRTIESTPLGGDNFALDRVPSRPPNLIYVKRSGARRVALFGSNLACSPPVLYRAPDGSVTISAAAAEDEGLTILRMAPATGSVSPPIPAGFELPGLLRLMGTEAGVGLSGEAVGLGLDYGAVARALYHLCKDHSINARFMLEQPRVAELLGPARRTGRPESEPGD